MKILLAAFVAVVAMETAALAGAPPGWPTGKQQPEAPKELKPGDINGGSAAFTIGKSASKLPVASGSIQKSGEVYIVDLTFKDAASTSNNVVMTDGKILRIGFGTMKEGPALMTTTFVARDGNVLSVLRKKPPVEGAGIPKNKKTGTCTITVTKIEEKVVEGTASCPSGMLDMDDKDAPPVTDVTFKATAL